MQSRLLRLHSNPAFSLATSHLGGQELLNRVWFPAQTDLAAQLCSDGGSYQLCSFPMRLGKISVLLCFQDTLKIFTLLVHAKSASLARSRCPALAWKLTRHLARKKARTILPSFLPSFLPSQSPTAKPSLSPTEDPTRGSSCCRKSQSLTSGKSAATVQASFMPESGPTSAPMVGTVVRLL